MNWGAVLGITVATALMALYEWPKIDPSRKKEKAAFVTLTAVGWLLALLLLFVPELPGPTQMVDAIFRPLGKMLE